jgi:hypothetical protein
VTGSPSRPPGTGPDQGPGAAVDAGGPLTDDAGKADLAVLERYADPQALLAAEWQLPPR